MAPRLSQKAAPKNEHRARGHDRRDRLGGDTTAEQQPDTDSENRADAGGDPHASPTMKAYKKRTKRVMTL
jgi:hypothetical protein